MDNKKDLLNDLKIDRSEDNKSESSLSTKLLIIAGVVILLLTLVNFIFILSPMARQASPVLLNGYFLIMFLIVCFVCFIFTYHWYVIFLYVSCGKVHSH